MRFKSLFTSRAIDAPTAAPERDFSSWIEASAHASAAAYDDDSLSAFRVARAELHQPDGAILSGNILGLIAQLVGGSDLSITDFGGACGPLGRDYLRAYPSATYTVVETPSLVRRLGARPGWPVFTTTMPEQCDIFYCSGTLQYIPQPLALWQVGLRSAARFAVIGRTTFSDVERFMVQRSMLFDNGGGKIPEGFENKTISYPRRTIVEAEIHHIAEKHGFGLALSLNEWVEQDHYSKHLVFKRL